MNKPARDDYIETCQICGYSIKAHKPKCPTLSFNYFNMTKPDFISFLYYKMYEIGIPYPTCKDNHEEDLEYFIDNIDKNDLIDFAEEYAIEYAGSLKIDDSVILTPEEGLKVILKDSF